MTAIIPRIMKLAIWTACLCAVVSGESTGFAVDDIAPRTSPVLGETSMDIEPRAWLSEDLQAAGASVIWTKSIWGLSDDKWYNTWEDRAPWGNTSPWYVTFPRVVAFQDKLVGMFTERNEPHGSGDTVIHLMTSDFNGNQWTTVAHYEVETGFNNTHFTITRITD